MATCRIQGKKYLVLPGWSKQIGLACWWIQKTLFRRGVNVSKGGLKNKNREERVLIIQRHYHVSGVVDKTIHINLTYQFASSRLTKTNNVMCLGICGHYQIHWNPFLGVGRQYFRIITCCCDSCINTIKIEWVEGKYPAEQPSF